MGLLKCSLTVTSGLLNFLSSIYCILTLIINSTGHPLPFPCSALLCIELMLANRWSFGNCFLLGLAKGKYWVEVQRQLGKLFIPPTLVPLCAPFLQEALPSMVPVYVIAPNQSKWLHYLHDPRSSLVASVFFFYHEGSTLMTFWVSGSLLPASGL